MSKKPPKMVRNEQEQLIDLVERTADAMTARLLAKHHEGRRGWRTDIGGLIDRLHRAVYRQDYLDVSILAAMLYDYQRRNAQREVTGG